MNIFILIDGGISFCKVKDNFDPKKFDFYVYNGMYHGEFDNGVVSIRTPHCWITHKNCKIVDESEICQNEIKSLKNYADPNTIEEIMRNM